MRWEPQAFWGVLTEGKEMLTEQMRKRKDNFPTCLRFLLCLLPRKQEEEEVV